MNSFPENLINPRDYTAPASDNATSRGTVNKVFELSEDQIFNNSSQGEGIAGPSKFGGPDGYKVATSSAEAGSKAGSGCSVSLGDGQNSSWNGGKPE